MKNITVNPEFSYAESFVRSLPVTFDGTGKMLYNERNVVKSFTVEGNILVVKRYKRPNIVQRVAYTFFKKSKAERAYVFAKMMRDRGIDTPHEVAYIEIRDGLLMSDSYFVSTSCTLPALSTLLRRPDFSHDAADALASFLVKLHLKGVLHGDLNLTNILYEEHDGRYHFALIDTNRSKFKTPTRADCLENLKRLTHDKPLMAYVIGRYAEERGWDGERTTVEIIGRLRRFERKREMKRKIERPFKKLFSNKK